jgi:hypothetical protein
VNPETDEVQSGDFELYHSGKFLIIDVEGEAITLKQQIGDTLLSFQITTQNP